MSIKGEFLLTEIALNLLGNKFYDIDGKYVEDLQSLYNLNRETTNYSSDEQNLESLLELPNANANSNVDFTEVITIDDDDSENILSDIIQEKNSELFNLLEQNVNSRTMNENPSSTESNIQTVEEDSQNNRKVRSRKCSSSKQLFNSKNYNSDDANERLEYILSSAEIEYEKMKNDSIVLKNRFLQVNKTLIDLKSLKPDEFLNKFYSQQKCSFLEESSALIQFIRMIKHENDTDPELLEQIIADIHATKEHLS